MYQNYESLRVLEATVLRNVKEFIGKAKRTEILSDSEGNNVLYINFTQNGVPAAGDEALYVRTLNPLSNEVADNFIARSNSPSKVIHPAPIFEIIVENGSMSSARGVLKDRFLLFINQKQGRNAIVRYVDEGVKPTLKDIFAEAADNFSNSVSAPVAAAGMIGGN